ncbi:MAG: CBS domain-containing protein [Candidatus Binatia bacterium]
MKTVRDILEVKGYHVWSIGPSASIFDALELMADREVGALMVTEGTKVIGIISERDYARKVILKGGSSKSMQVKEIMTTHVVFTRLQHNVEECMTLMTEKHIRHLPVIEADQLVGVISIGDLVKSIITEQKFIIEQLEQYIHG